MFFLLNFQKKFGFLGWFCNKIKKLIFLVGGGGGGEGWRSKYLLKI